MLQTFYVENFKNIVEAKDGQGPLRFSECTLFVGPNGVGKTSLFQAIDFLRAFLHYSVQDYLKERGWDYIDIPNLRKTQKKISWRTSFEIPPDKEGSFGGKYYFDVTLLKRRYLNVGVESLTYIPFGENTRYSLIDRRGRKTKLYSHTLEESESFTFYQLPSSVMTYIEGDLSERQKYPEIMHFMQYLQGIRYMSILDVDFLREPARGYAEEVGPKGENLAPYLAFLSARQPELFNRIKRQILKLFPHLTDLRIRGADSSSAFKRIEVNEGVTSFNPMQVSDGFLRILAVVSMLYSPSPPSILLFEEPENGVHPRLLRDLLDIFMAMPMRKNPHSTQVILSTHSPYLLDYFRDRQDSVYTLHRDRPQAGVTFSRLDELGLQEDLPMSLGELWYADKFFGA